MGVLHGLLVAGVIGLIAVVPCLICALFLSADELISRGLDTVRGWLPAGREGREERSATGRRPASEAWPTPERWSAPRVRPAPGERSRQPESDGQPEKDGRPEKDGQPKEDGQSTSRGRSALGGRWSRTRLGRRWQLSRFGRGIDGITHGRPPRAAGPPIEQVAGDLRRLNGLRQSVATRSRVWYVAVQEAYDDGLHVACEQLGVEEHLDELAGVDLELERLRVEGELQRAGLVLRNAGAQQR